MVTAASDDQVQRDVDAVAARGPVAGQDHQPGAKKAVDSATESCLALLTASTSPRPSTARA